MVLNHRPAASAPPVSDLTFYPIEKYVAVITTYFILANDGFEFGPSFDAFCRELPFTFPACTAVTAADIRLDILDPQIELIPAPRRHLWMFLQGFLFRDLDRAKEMPVVLVDAVLACPQDLLISVPTSYFHYVED